MTCEIIILGRTRPLNQPFYIDRDCIECREPMIGINKMSGSRGPRKVCYECGGKPDYVLDKHIPDNTGGLMDEKEKRY